MIIIQQKYQDKLAGLTRIEDFIQLDGEVYRQARGRHTKKVTLSNQTFFIKAHTGVGWWRL